MEVAAPLAGGLRCQTVTRHSQEKLAKAAHDFEAFLLTSLLGPLERSFSAVPGGQSEAEADTYQYLGVQAMATALASSGGIGIAELVVRNLKGTKVTG